VSRGRIARIVLWLAGIGACLAVIAQARFVADLSSFLPEAPTERQRLLVDQLKSGALSRMVLMGIEGATPEARAGLSRSVAGALRADPAFAGVANGSTAGLERERDLLLANRYALSPAVDPHRFSVAGLRESVGETIALLASPLGLAMGALVPRDPTGEMGVLLDRLAPSGGPLVRDGVWVSADGRRALLVTRTRTGAADIDGQARAMSTAQSAFAAAASRMGGEATGARLVMTGPGVFSVRARTMIESEVTKLSAAATAVVVVVLLWAYRSFVVLGLGLLPVLSGAIAGIAAVALGHGVVHGITLGFGTTLIGEAVDYSIYFFVQSRRGAAARDARGLDAFWPTIRLGLATSIAGFSAMLLSSLPGLSQFGLYSITGLVVAALVTRHVLPALAPTSLQVRDLSGIGRRLLAAMEAARPLRFAVLAAAAASIAVLATRTVPLWDRDLASLNPIGEADRALDAELRAGLAAPDARYLIAAFSPTQDGALAAAEAVGRHLDPLVREGTIAGYDSPAGLLPSLATQSARRASLPDEATLRARLAEALAGLPLRPGKLEPFIADVQAARLAAPLGRDAFRGTTLDLALDGMLYRDEAGQWTALVGLRGLGGVVERAPIDAALARAAVPGAMLIDVKAEADSLYAGYFEQAVRLGSLGAAVVCLLLALALRSVRRTARIVMPLAAALLVVVAFHALAGNRLTVPHLVGLTLVVAIGSNYALFVDGMAERPAEDNATTLASLALANFTTVASFGLLGTSSIPIVDAIGSTVAAGALLALVFCAAFAGRAKPAGVPA